ncbi:MAG: tyrosine-type recombinase/integrase [Blautia faecis]
MAIMELLYSTAGRIGEVVALNRDDVDFVNREIIIYGQKGKKERKVYLTEGCVYHLKKYLESRDDNNPALFVRGGSRIIAWADRQYKTCSETWSRGRSTCASA